ncbi:hypothetical protein CG51_03660 [Haematobacter missouriensis]|uniref:Uncharacterized protein n=1 Tax=Haematobacter missouriensis TaxID=366616 RepID=A0A212AWY1_9RHOB|nr:hypothetical protein CG51_03660 [Haematobacter missouriensis]OWJ71254.1 hypothetical protein CDV53_18810 [Haematobacter missouriensis]OWJ85970.1 hypothetical protein CDV52_02060 [Haematobacter missouriensis]
MVINRLIPRVEGACRGSFRAGARVFGKVLNNRVLKSIPSLLLHGNLCLVVEESPETSGLAPDKADYVVFNARPGRPRSFQ